ncbi:hypothetical protein EH151_04140 [Elizabethkingia anophelis]|uniref:P-loop NTPase fold protein n=1 Tax=Elizabethkingia anophelis TaxID=1117645 RepID=UPI0013681FCD|nr:P-loop NTPase fold protein [Elizabethkingia anophelis]MYZ59081.1 hypothetical protein [Elizabethkingia anophelis]
MKDSSIDENVLNYKFLTNKALGEDLFKNKSQAKIADVISKNIINEKDFKIIGIDGTWGAGKSNLVYLLQKKISDTHTFFIYDVWGHQEDEQRKAILVELTEFIKNKSDLLKKDEKKNWDDKLKILLANSKETTTINQPYLSVGFIFSLLSIIYIPTVNVFKDSLRDFFNIESWFWKLVLVTFPICIVIGIYIYNFFRNLINRNKIWKSFCIAAEETFQVYTNKQKEETKIETISENQPSVRDFQKWMKEIDDDLNKKIVIVFDNFDRLPKKHILNIWSSIHIFFAEKEYKNIKVILPFDREHVQNAFKELNSDVDDKTFGDDYINKTFDIVFRVTLPIMSDWKQFFENQWKIAFSNYDQDELQMVMQVYEFLSRRTTPREIIAFINEILTVKLLDADFKERYIAIFVLKKAEILKQPLKSITSLDYLGGLKSIYDNDITFAKQLTAIIYHVEIENAVEVIYTQELKDALNKFEVEKFNSICETDFADSIFSAAISQIDVFENPIKTLAKLNENAKIHRLHISQAWQTFYYKVLVNNKDVDNLYIHDWQLILLRNYDDDKYLKLLLDRFHYLVNDENTMDYVGLIDKILEVYDESTVLMHLKEKNISAKNFINLVELKDKDYVKYKLIMDTEELDAYIADLSVDDILKLKNTSVLNSNFELLQYKEVLKTVFNNLVDKNEGKKANDVLLKLKEAKKDENGDLENLLTDSQIYGFYSNNYSSDLSIINELIAMRIARGKKFDTSYVSKFSDVLLDADKSRVNFIADTILNYVKYEDLLLEAKNFDTSPLFKAIILKLFNSDIKKSLDVTEIISEYDIIKSSLGLNDNSLLIELDNWRFDKTQLKLDSLGDEFIHDCFANLNSFTAQAFNENFNEEFKELDYDAVKSLFDKGTGIQFRFFSNLSPNSLTQTSLDAFESSFANKIEEEKTNDDWWQILDKYEKNNANLSVENMLKNIQDKFLNGQIDLNIEIAYRILPYFTKYKILDAQRDVFRTIIKNNFLSDDKFIDILMIDIVYIKNLYQNSSPTQREGFKNTINELSKTSEKVNDLGKKLGIL